LKRLVIDASVLVPAIAEVESGLRKPYFRSRVEEQEIDEIVATIRDAGIMLRDPVNPSALLRDPNDDYLVALAREARAEAIVTGDRDLLDHPGLAPPALHARDACKLLGLLE
jgi:uncharacterized protein